MDLYEFFKFIHVLAAAAWVGGVIISHVQGFMVQKAGDQERALNYTREQNWLGTHYFMPASITVLVAGIVMVIESGWDWQDLWIVIGIALYAASVIIGAALMGPRGVKIEAAIVEKGVADPDVQAQAATLKRLSQIDLVILVLVVADMVIKPGT